MIKIVLFDIDGVVTDGRITVDANGNELKSLNLRDIDAIYEIKRRGYKIGALTGESTVITDYFEKRFPWDFFYRGCKDKTRAIREIEASEGVCAGEICYVGDGKYDAGAVVYAGLGVCPSDSIGPVRRGADLIIGAGGTGALWELLEHIENMSGSPETGFFRAACEEHIGVFKAILGGIGLQKNILALCEKIAESLDLGGRILLFGNGGSAADAQHIAAEFVGRLRLERRAVDAEALCANMSSITAIGNDYGFEDIFARQAEAKGRPGDVLIGISTSGTSKNVVKALEFGRGAGMICALLTGRTARALPFVDFEINVPCDNTQRIQEAHIFIGHIICEYVENKLFGTGHQTS
jgi:D-sedoheptulose 7-phosphate isomerase